MSILSRVRLRGGGQTLSAPKGEGGWVPPETVVYAIGDVHGRADLLHAMISLIDHDRDELEFRNRIVVCLGDYVDRGPDSEGVLRQLVELRKRTDLSAVCLKGNHEAMLLDFIKDPARAGPMWLRMGGWETLRSYGVSCSPQESAASQLRRARDGLLDALPASQKVLLEELALSHEIGGYFFAHAGVRPGVALEHQSQQDLLWIRGGFSDRDEQFEKIIVHGHSPVAKPFVGINRINVDTGAYATGRLSCVILWERALRLAEVSV